MVEFVGCSSGKTDGHEVTKSYGEGKTTSAAHISARNLTNADEVMRMP